MRDTIKRFRRMTSVCFCWSNAYDKSSTNVISCVTQEWLEQKPCLLLGVVKHLGVIISMSF